MTRLKGLDNLWQVGYRSTAPSAGREECAQLLSWLPLEARKIWKLRDTVIHVAMKQLQSTNATKNSSKVQALLSLIIKFLDRYEQKRPNELRAASGAARQINTQMEVCQHELTKRARRMSLNYHCTIGARSGEKSLSSSNWRSPASWCTSAKNLIECRGVWRSNKWRNSTTLQQINLVVDKEYDPTQTSRSLSLANSQAILQNSLQFVEPRIASVCWTHLGVAHAPAYQHLVEKRDCRAWPPWKNPKTTGKGSWTTLRTICCCILSK